MTFALFQFNITFLTIQSAVCFVQNTISYKWPYKSAAFALYHSWWIGLWMIIGCVRTRKVFAENSLFLRYCLSLALKIKWYFGFLIVLQAEWNCVISWQFRKPHEIFIHLHVHIKHITNTNFANPMSSYCDMFQINLSRDCTLFNGLVNYQKSSQIGS